MREVPLDGGNDARRSRMRGVGCAEGGRREKRRASCSRILRPSGVPRAYASLSGPGGREGGMSEIRTLMLQSTGGGKRGWPEGKRKERKKGGREKGGKGKGRKETTASKRAYVTVSEALTEGDGAFPALGCEGGETQLHRGGELSEA